MKHSPLPWTLVDNGWEIWDDNERSIACTGHDDDRGEFGKLLNEVNGAFIVKAVNAHDDLVAACKAALHLAWETGCETDDGVHTLLDDARGDLYRQLSAALAKAL